MVVALGWVSTPFFTDVIYCGKLSLMKAKGQEGVPAFSSLVHIMYNVPAVISKEKLRTHLNKDSIE